MPSPLPDGRRGATLYRLWLAMAAVGTALMWWWPGDETIPYHVTWATFALLYGLGNWSLRRAVVGVALNTVATGFVLVARAAAGVLTWQETAEIPLMGLLAVLMVWHVRRRQLALAAVTLVAEQVRDRARDREQLMRLTSHELRTPLTISRGYIELVLRRETDPETLRDLEVVDDELDRLTRVTARLLRVIQLQGDAETEPVDLDDLLSQTVERWTPVASRRWVVHADAGVYEGSAERMRASLDTLIENALRYTSEGDTVRLSATRDDRHIEVAVADSGRGMSAERIAAINEAGLDDDGLGGTATTTGPPRDDLSQTGLGLGLVRGLASARGGRLLAGRAPEGGAMLVLRLPLDDPAVSAHTDLAAALDELELDLEPDRSTDGPLDRRLSFRDPPRRDRAPRDAASVEGSSRRSRAALGRSRGSSSASPVRRS
jgi:two-component system OmpR family sensor kinase